MSSKPTVIQYRVQVPDGFADKARELSRRTLMLDPYRMSERQFVCERQAISEGMLTLALGHR